MPNLFRNNAATTLASPVLTSDTTLVLATNTGARFPTPVIGEWFFVTVQSGVNFEIMKCTARAGDILTVERAQDGSSLQNWLAGNSVDMRIPRITLENFVQKNEVALLAAGSAAAPSVTFGDADTGIYGPTAGELGFSVNGLERMRIGSPRADVIVIGDGGGPNLSSDTNNISLTSSNTSVELAEGAYSSGAFAYWMQVKQSVNLGVAYPLSLQPLGGNVGIGTSSPSKRLEVLNSADNLQIGAIVRNDQAGAGVAAIGFNVSSSAAAETTSTKAGIGLVRGTPYGGGALAFYNNNSGAAGDFIAADEKMRIDPSGNVGIGTSSPLQRLSAVNTSITGGAPASSGSAADPNAVARFGAGSVVLDVGATLAGAMWLQARAAGNYATNYALSLNPNGGDVDVAGSLRFNSGYGSAALAFGVRAWVNFDGVNLVNLNGTYSQSGTTVTVNATNHGLSVGHTLFADITSGTGVDGAYTVVSVVDANTFTYTAGTSLTTSGNISLPRCVVRGAGNIGSVVRVATGDYVVNFTIAMPDTNYVAIANTSNTVGGANAVVPMMWTAGRAAVSCRFGCSDNNTDTLSNAGQIDFTVIR